MRCFVIHIVRVVGGDFFELALLDVLFRFFPVDGGYEVFVVLGGVYFQKRVFQLGIVRSEEGPAMRFAFAGVRQVVVESRQQHLKSYIHTTAFFVNTDEREHAFEVFGIAGNLHVFLRIRHAETGTGHHILGVFGGEW